MKKINRISFLFLLPFLISSSLKAQKVIVRGKVFSKTELDFVRIIAVNLNTNIGILGTPNGSFEIQCNKKDTILISVIGYEMQKISMSDSILKNEYWVNINLKPIIKNLPTMNIFSQRTLEKIYKDIETLGYSEKDYRISQVDALESPITFLYEAFSRRAQAKRRAIELQNDERRRDLLKELFAQYVDAGIMELDKREFDVFIDYCNVSDFVLQNTSQYEFILLIKEKYKAFKPY